MIIGNWKNFLNPVFHSLRSLPFAALRETEPLQNLLTETAFLHNRQHGWYRLKPVRWLCVR